MTVTKKELADKIARNVGFSVREASQVLETLLELMKQTLERGEKLVISGFGTFQVKEKSPRMGRNPTTGNALPLEARRVVLFRWSPTLRRKLNKEGLKDD